MNIKHNLHKKKISNSLFLFSSSLVLFFRYLLCAFFFIEFLIFLACLSFIFFSSLSYIAFCFGLAFLACLFVLLKFCGDLFLGERGWLWHFSFEAPPIHKKGLVEDRTLSWSGLSTFFWHFPATYISLYFANKFL